MAALQVHVTPALSTRLSLPSNPPGDVSATTAGALFPRRRIRMQSLNPNPTRISPRSASPGVTPWRVPSSLGVKRSLQIPALFKPNADLAKCAHLPALGEIPHRRDSPGASGSPSPGTAFASLSAWPSPALFTSNADANTIMCKASSSVSSPAQVGEVQVEFHELPSSLRLEVRIQKGTPQESAGKPPLLFIHGSYHAAWCWAEYWMPFFASHGYDCYAVSLLGQGSSDSPSGKVAGTIQSHAADLSHFIRNGIGRAPVLIGHSFGGLIVQAYLSLLCPQSPSDMSMEPLAGAVLVCSVPPAGNKDLVMRFLVTRPILSIKVTLSLAAKMFATNAGLCRDSFFSPSMPEDQVLRYQKLLADSSKMPLFDLRQLNASLPVPKPNGDSCPPLLILGAQNDAVLDTEALEETSRFFQAPFVVIPDIAHDIMLDTQWEPAAEALLSWLR